jgi:hypothetical protein
MPFDNGMSRYSASHAFTTPPKRNQPRPFIKHRHGGAGEASSTTGTVEMASTALQTVKTESNVYGFYTDDFDKKENAVDTAPTIASIPLSEKEKIIYERAIAKSTKTGNAIDALGSPKGDGTQEMIIKPRPVQYTTYFHEFNVSKFNLCFFMHLLYIFFMAAMFINAMIAVLASIHGYEPHLFFLLSSIFGGIIFAFDTIATWKYLKDYHTFSPDHMKSITTIWLSATLSLFVAWISMLVWTKDYPQTHVNWHNPEMVNKFCVSMIFYAMGFPIVMMNIGSFLISMTNVEKVAPEVVVTERIVGGYSANEVAALKANAKQLAANEFALSTVKLET